MPRPLQSLVMAEYYRCAGFRQFFDSAVFMISRFSSPVPRSPRAETPVYQGEMGHANPPDQFLYNQAAYCTGVTFQKLHV